MAEEREGSEAENAPKEDVLILEPLESLYALHLDKRQHDHLEDRVDTNARTQAQVVDPEARSFQDSVERVAGASQRDSTRENQSSATLLEELRCENLPANIVHVSIPLDRDPVALVEVVYAQHKYANEEFDGCYMELLCMSPRKGILVMFETDHH